jgi:catechol 2,3-dioxygenase-like lactoylglutathione lyase family enzyme
VKIHEFGVLGFGQPHHVGMVVPDLDKAIADMADIGEWIRFATNPRRPDVDVGVPIIAETVEVPLKAAMSREGPVHVELLEGVPGTIWSPRHEAYLHHLAYEVPQELLVDYSRQLEARGMVREATRVSGATTALSAVYHRWPTGLRIELLVWGLAAGIVKRG